MAFRFLHTADWHLGKPFGGFGAEVGAHLRAQRLKTIRGLAELAAHRQVDAVLVAGDIFDDHLASQATLTGAVGAMAGFGGDWVLLPGNHDAAELGSVWERVRPLVAGLPRIHLATGPEPLPLADGQAAVLPAPLRRRHESEDLTAVWEGWATAAGAIRVGLGHGSVRGRLPGEAEAHNPIAADRAATARLDYLALGDWHGTFRVSERTYYCGTPEPDSFKENDTGKALLVEIAAPGAMPTVEAIATGHYHWSQRRAALHTRGDVEQLDRELAEMEAPGRRIVRLELSGALGLAEMLALERRLEWWRGQVEGLEIERRDLHSRVGEEEFARLQPPGFVGAAAEALRGREAAGESAAAEARTILYGLCAGATAPEAKP